MNEPNEMLDNLPVVSWPEIDHKMFRDMRLAEIGEKANEAFIDAGVAAQASVKNYLLTGVYLQALRKKFPSDTAKGDAAFGKAAIKYCPNISPDWRSRLMQVSAKYWRDDRALSVPFSTLRELTRADDDLSDQILDRAASGEKITKRQVKEEIKQSQPQPDPAPEPKQPVTIDQTPEPAEPDPNKKQAIPDPGSGSSLSAKQQEQQKELERVRSDKELEIQTQKMICAPLGSRIWAYDENPNEVDAWMVLGLPPNLNVDFNPSKETVETLYEALREKISIEEQYAILDRAFKDIMESY